ncbi:hypothetical protein GMMP13_1860007 [Candidatus Magnetomoraceae bacterium gMMP-13]
MSYTGQPCAVAALIPVRDELLFPDNPSEPVKKKVKNPESKAQKRDNSLCLKGGRWFGANIKTLIKNKNASPPNTHVAMI